MDPIIAVAILALALLGTTSTTVDAAHPTSLNLLAYVLTVIGFGSLAFRTRAPLLTLALSITSAALYSAIEYPENGLPIAPMIALYTVASRTPRKQSLIAAGVVVVVLVWLTIIGAQGLDATGMITNLAVFGIAYASGRYVQVRRAYTEQLELRAAEADAQRRRDAERAVAEERLRIARELHDVVAHAMSVVAVQSGIAAHVIDQRPTRPGDARDDQRPPAARRSTRCAGCSACCGPRTTGRPRPGAGPGARRPRLARQLGRAHRARRCRSRVEGDRGGAAVGARPRRLPHRAGGADQRGEARRSGPRRRARSATAPTRSRSRSPTTVGAQLADLGPSAAGHGLVGMRERVELYGGDARRRAPPGGRFPGGGRAALSTEAT